MIRSFADQRTARLFGGELSKGIGSDVGRAALRRLVQLHTATRLAELAVPPGNRLEALRGGRNGQHSIRVNVQWRICFIWRDGDAYEVELVDYH